MFINLIFFVKSEFNTLFKKHFSLDLDICYHKQIFFDLFITFQTYFRVSY